MRKFGLCLFYGLCVFTIAFSLFWMALPRLPLPEAPADETPPISGSVSSLVQAAAPTAAGYYLCDTGGRVAVYACNADGTPGALQQLTGIYVNLLPENDVLRIRRGIRVHKNSDNGTISSEFFTEAGPPRPSTANETATCEISSSRIFFTIT